MRSTHLLALFVGVGIGGVGGWLLGQGAASEPVATPQLTSNGHQGDEPSSASQPSLQGSQPDTAGDDAAPPTLGPEDVAVQKSTFEQDYRAGYAQTSNGSEAPADQLAAVWKEHTSRLEQAARAAGMAAGRAEAARRTQVEIEARDDILTLLANSESHDTARAAARSAKRFAALFAHQSRGGSTIGDQDDGAQDPALLEDGSTLELSAGVHKLGTKWTRNSVVPRDLTIRGAGMDRTLLVLSDLSARSPLYNLHLADMTIDCDNDGAFDLRSEMASISAERVRFVRFDAAHGGAYVFDVSRPGAVNCSDCEFVAWYGRSPGRGNVFRRITAARFDSCLFDGFVYDTPTVGVYSGCTFRDCRGIEARMERALATPDTQGFYYYEGCRVDWTLPPEERDTHTRSQPARDWEAFRRSFER